MWAWKFLKECPAERAVINTANKLRLCIYSQKLFDQINRTEHIDYDRRVGGALYLYRDREHFDRGVGAMKVLTDGGVKLEPVGPDRIVEIEPALSGEKDSLAGAIYCPTDGPAIATSSLMRSSISSRTIAGSHFIGTRRSSASSPTGVGSQKLRRVGAR